MQSKVVAAKIVAAKSPERPNLWAVVATDGISGYWNAFGAFGKLRAANKYANALKKSWIGIQIIRVPGTQEARDA